MASVILKSQTTLATMLKNDVLTKKIDAEQAVQILVAYLVRSGAITEFALPTATE